jgi:hypothetical protein
MTYPTPDESDETTVILHAPDGAPVEERAEATMAEACFRGEGDEESYGLILFNSAPV